MGAAQTALTLTTTAMQFSLEQTSWCKSLGRSSLHGDRLISSIVHNSRRFCIQPKWIARQALPARPPTRCLLPLRPTQGTRSGWR